MKQCSQMTARKDFAFKPTHKGARRVTVKAGATFWVSSSETMQKSTGLIHIARVTQPMHYDYPFTPEQIVELFDTLN